MRRDDNTEALARKRLARIEDEAGPAVVANIRPLSDFEPESTRWLWDHRIPYGKLSIVEGPPDVGKSTFTIWLASMVSRGGVLPDGGRVERGNVVLVTCEDGIADTVRPRVDAAGGDPDAVFILSGFSPNGDEERLPVIPDDVPAIRKAVEDKGARLLIIDPLSAYLGERVNGHHNQDVRRALAPLQRMAEETGCAVLIVGHLRKGASGPAIWAGNGSGAFAALARVVMLAAKDPDDDSRRILAWTKNNLAPTQSSLAYRLVSNGSEWAHVEWEGVSRYSANDLLAVGQDDEEKGKTDQAADWLAEYLRDGAMPAAEIKRAGRAAGFSDRTVERARERTGVVWKRIGAGRDSYVEWRLGTSAGGDSSLTPPPHGEYGAERASKSLQNNGSTYSPRGLASMDEGSISAKVGEYAADAPGLTPEQQTTRREILAKYLPKTAAAREATPDHGGTGR